MIGDELRGDRDRRRDEFWPTIESIENPSLDFVAEDSSTVERADSVAERILEVMAEGAENREGRGAEGRRDGDERWDGKRDIFTKVIST